MRDPLPPGKVLPVMDLTQGLVSVECTCIRFSILHLPTCYRAHLISRALAPSAVYPGELAAEEKGMGWCKVCKVPGAGLLARDWGQEISALLLCSAQARWSGNNGRLSRREMNKNISELAMESFAANARQFPASPQEGIVWMCVLMSYIGRRSTKAEMCKMYLAAKEIGLRWRKPLLGETRVILPKTARGRS